MSGKKVLLVLTSNTELGFYLPEFSHPYKIFHKAGCVITIASVSGGKPTVTPSSVSSDEAWWTDNQHLVDNTPALDGFKGDDFDLVFYVGGFGVMWDFPTSEAVARIGQEVYENKGFVAAVCHGPIALMNMKAKDGSYLINGKKVTAFTNEEENLAGNVPLPVLLPTGEKTPHDVLSARGAVFEEGPAWGPNVRQDGSIFTGQNPASAEPLAEKILAAWA